MERNSNFCIHISSCLVQCGRAKYLKQVLHDFIIRFPGHEIYVGFDIVGLEHKNGECLRQLFSENSNLHHFTHCNGLGYSWNYPWTLHNYNVVLQTEDDWLLPNLSLQKANDICDFVLTRKNAVFSVAKHERDGEEWQQEKIYWKSVSKEKFTAYLVNNHPHFETREYRKIVGPFVEFVTPPVVEESYYKRANKVRDEIEIWCTNGDETHIGNESSNHPCAWANFLIQSPPNYKYELPQSLTNLQIITKTKNQTIYDMLREKTDTSVIVAYPSAYMYETRRFKEASEFLADFFNYILLITDDKCVDTLQFIKKLETPYKFTDINVGVFKLIKKR